MLILSRIPNKGVDVNNLLLNISNNDYFHIFLVLEKYMSTVTLNFQFFKLHEFYSFTHNILIVVSETGGTYIKYCRVNM